MMQETLENRELVSALLDGQLRADELARTVASVGRSDDARMAWHAYHLIGDVLHSGDAGDSAHDAAFVQRLRGRLQQEAPRGPDLNAIDSGAVHDVTMRAGATKPSEDRAANDSIFRRRRLVGLASLALVSVIGWQAAGGWGGAAGVPGVAQVPLQEAASNPSSVAAVPQTVVAGEPQVMLRDRQLDALLAAHKQFGGTSALQVPTGFLRNATFEGAAR